MSHPAYPPYPVQPPRKPRKSHAVLWTLLGVAGGLLGLLLASLLLGSGPTASAGSYEACQARMEADFRQAMSDPSYEPRTTAPAECAGLSEADLTEIAGQILAEHLR